MVTGYARPLSCLSSGVAGSNPFHWLGFCSLSFVLSSGGSGFRVDWSPI